MTDDIKVASEILEGCNSLKECATIVKSTDKSILEAKEKCNRNNLKVEEANFEKSFDDIYNDIQVVVNTANELANRVEELTYKKYDPNITNTVNE